VKKTFLPGVGLAVILAGGATSALAAPPSSSAYASDTQHSYVQDATSDGIGGVNMITCFMNSMRPEALVNQPAYKALVDKNKCDPRARSGTSDGGASGSSSAADYMSAIVKSTRASNTDPMLVNLWITDDEEGRKSLIYAHISAIDAPSTANPYGVFRLDYCGKDAVAGGACRMNGFLQGATTGLSYYEDDGAQGGTIALTLTNSSSSQSGSGRLQLNQGSQQAAYDFAYNQSLFRRYDGTLDQCFSRDATDPATGLSVWRYGLYDASTGDRIDRHSGFPIEFTANGTTYQGYLGYWGLSLPASAEAAVTNGTTVQKVDYNSGSTPTRTPYTMVLSAGKLTKYTRHTKTLQQIDHIHFTVAVGDASGLFAGAVSNTQYDMYWDDSLKLLKVAASIICASNGCETSTFASEKIASMQFFASHGGVSAWSQSLGGELFIDLTGLTDPVQSDKVTVAYRSQDLVYPADLPATLYCVNDCPSAASLQGYFAGNSGADSPYAGATFNNWNPTPAASVVTYTSDTATVTLKDASGAPVVYTASMSARPQFQSGVRSGRLFTSLAASECSSGSQTYCDWKVNALDVFYVWETGPNNWNQFAAVKAADGNFVTFDPPLQVSYTVPGGAAYGEYAGKTLVLQYGGFGDLGGIPGHCVSNLTNANVSCDTQNARYVPAFAIPYDATAGVVTAGSTTYLVKWLEREIRFASKDISVCTGANLSLPSGVQLPSAAGLKDPSDPNSDVYVGLEPTVTDAVRVVQGEVKF
jgi:hypothetical protein